MLFRTRDGAWRPEWCENCFRPSFESSVLVFARIANPVKDQKAEQQIRLITEVDEFLERHFDFPSMRGRFPDFVPRSDQVHCYVAADLRYLS